MDAGQLFSMTNLIWLAFAFQIAGYLARDELKLRLLMLCGGLAYIAFYLGLSGGPLWAAVATNVLLVAINTAVTAIVIHERTMIGITGETADIYSRFPLLRPGQFRKLLKAGRIDVATGDHAIIRQGDEVRSLYFVLDGSALVSKGSGAIDIGPNVFLGEVAYLTGARASATVSLREGSRYIEWPHDALEQMIRRHSDMRVALLALLNLDMAGKVAASLPRDVRDAAGGISGGPDPVPVIAIDPDARGAQV